VDAASALGPVSGCTDWLGENVVELLSTYNSLTSGYMPGEKEQTVTSASVCHSNYVVIW
jgi:hypothetical protein